MREVVCDVDVDGAPGFGFVAAGGEVGDVVRDFVGCCGYDVGKDGEDGEEQGLREKHFLVFGDGMLVECLGKVGCV